MGENNLEASSKLRGGDRLSQIVYYAILEKNEELLEELTSTHGDSIIEESIFFHALFRDVSTALDYVNSIGYRVEQKDLDSIDRCVNRRLKKEFRDVCG